MGQGWGCECLQPLPVIRRPEAPAVPLPHPEMGRQWRCYAFMFLARVWVHISFPPGCSGTNGPQQSLLPGLWWVSPLQRLQDPFCHRARPLFCSGCCRTIMFLRDVPGFQLCLCVSLDEKSAGQGASHGWQQLCSLLCAPPGCGERDGAPSPLGGGSGSLGPFLVPGMALQRWRMG